MDTLSFFETVLPETGPYFLVIFVEGRAQPAHISCASIQELADQAAKYDAKRGVSVYFACSSYKEPSVQVGEKKKYRVEPNWNRAKALWCDIDVGEDKAAKGKGYATKQDAANALVEFCEATGFPQPMIVDSGGGFHCYWPLTKAIVPTKWQALAGTLKAAFQHFGFKVDPTRTADFASILRPVGTANKKTEPGEPVFVRKHISPLDPVDLASKLQSIVDTFHVKREHVQRPSALPPPGLNDDLIAHLPSQIPSSALRVAENCQQFRMIRDQHGDVGYEHWRGGAGIFKHCIEGAEMFHKWSQGDARYDQYSTQVKVDTWSTGPTTCDFFEQANPDGCAGCPHQGKVKSPIILGRFEPPPEEQPIEVMVEGEKQESTIPALPSGYKWEDDYLVRYIQDKDGYLQAHKFSATLYYPYQRVRNESGNYAVMLRAHLPDGRIREFCVETSNVAAPADLMKVLAGRGEIFATTQKDSAMHHSAYLRDSLEALKRQAEEANTLLHFGWQEDGSFLAGERLYKRDGTIQRVLLGGNAASVADHYPDPIGTLDGYAQAVNQVYNDQSMVPLQYAFSSGYGSILSVFGEPTYHGLLLCLVGEKTGRGKTTVAKAALYGFGDAEKITMGARGFTTNGVGLRMGSYHNLPVLLDEMTGIKPDALSDLAYMVAQGIDKGRAQMRNGVAVQAKLATWRLSAYLTANRNVYTKLAGHAGNTEAQAVRLLQILVDEYDIKEFDDKMFVGKMLGQMADNMGCAGDAFIRYVVEHRGEVQNTVRNAMQQINERVQDQRLRFYVNHAATTLVATQITNKLGITEFDLGELSKFSIQLIRRAAGEAQETNATSPDKAFANMLADLSPRIVVSMSMRSEKDAEQVQRPQGSPAGRYVTGIPGRPSACDHHLYLRKSEITMWWHKTNNYSLKSLYDYLRDEGVLLDADRNVNLYQGTQLGVPGGVDCIVVDASKWVNLLPVSGNTNFSVVPGGKSAQGGQKAVP